MRTGKRKTRIRARRPASPRPPGVERVIEGMRVAGVPEKRTVRYLEDRFGGLCRARVGMAAIARTSVLPEATRVGALSARSGNRRCRQFGAIDHPVLLAAHRSRACLPAVRR
jgi:hypothetical protein